MPIAFTEAQRQQAIALHARWEAANIINRHDFVTVDDPHFPKTPALVVALGRAARAVWVRWEPGVPATRLSMDNVSKVEVPDALVPAWADQLRRDLPGGNLQVSPPVVEPVAAPVEPVEAEVGDTVTFDGGTGVVFWKGETRYGDLRVGVRTSDRRRGRSWADVEWFDIEDVTVTPG